MDGLSAFGRWRLEHLEERLCESSRIASQGGNVFSDSSRIQFHQRLPVEEELRDIRIAKSSGCVERIAESCERWNLFHRHHVDYVPHGLSTKVVTDRKRSISCAQAVITDNL